MRTELRAFVDSLITREREKRGAVPKPEKSDVDWRVRAFCGQVAPFMDGNAGSLMDDLHGLTYADLMRAWDRSDLCRYPINDLPNAWYDVLLRREVQSFVYSLIYEQRKLPEYQPPAQAAEVNTQLGGVAMLMAAQKKHDQRLAEWLKEYPSATTDWISQHLSPDENAESSGVTIVDDESGDRVFIPSIN